MVFIRRSHLTDLGFAGKKEKGRILQQFVFEAKVAISHCLRPAKLVYANRLGDIVGG
jgi:hypothetical protein